MYPKNLILDKYLNMTQQPPSDNVTECPELMERLLNARDVNQKLEDANKLIKQKLDRYKLLCETVVKKRKILKEKNRISKQNSSPATVKKETISIDGNDQNNRNQVLKERNTVSEHSITSSTSVKNEPINNDDNEQNDENQIPIGPHAKVHTRVLKNIKWYSYTDATRKILVDVFTRRVLATHSLTGKSSPAFPNKAPKKKLNSQLVEDIVSYVADRCHASVTAIRTSITTKCADEAKMLRLRKNKSK